MRGLHGPHWSFTVLLHTVHLPCVASSVVLAGLPDLTHSEEGRQGRHWAPKGYSFQLAWPRALAFDPLQDRQHGLARCQDCLNSHGWPRLAVRVGLVHTAGSGWGAGAPSGVPAQQDCLWPRSCLLMVGPPGASSGLQQRQPLVGDLPGAEWAASGGGCTSRSPENCLSGFQSALILLSAPGQPYRRRCCLLAARLPHPAFDSIYMEGCPWGAGGPGDILIGGRVWVGCLLHLSALRENSSLGL